MDIKKLDHSSVLAMLPDRQPESHKGDFGKILLLCGSCGYTGAPELAALGALRTGAGLVYLGVPNSIYTIMATKLTEPIVYPLFEENGKLSSKAIGQIDPLLLKMDAVLIGPGLGQSEGTLAVVEHVLGKFAGPVVIDADGINVLAVHKDILRGRTSPTILTPHFGEFCRFFGGVPEDRMLAAMEVAKDIGAVVLLKGNKTIITDGIHSYINTTGNPGMAVGGSGDVLAGVIVSLLGQGLPPLQSAACGAWLHGAAGDICAEEIGQYGMLPSDMLHVLPRLMK